jgi:hypothetical protein
MVNEVILNDFVIKVTNFKKDTVRNKTDKNLKVISFEFKVRGGNEYHDVTSHLYKTTFDVKVPEKDLVFRGTINNYSTSRTDFTDEDSIADFKLELIEVE